ncbi:MAG TPA: cobalt-precorrin-5B (C(1))-methyltransferase [Actinomycetota bacterium]|jgi:cobalt-precorrin-5B (C1)-methyltransferase
MAAARDVELREPDLPATARRVERGLRTGWTTGSCAAAAAKAATIALATGACPPSVDIGLPRSGDRVSFPVEACATGGGDEGVWAEAVVVKDAGDDPDVTHGARLTARVWWSASAGVRIEGGEGVGVVTRPGLGLAVGGPAINPVPRRQISAAAGEALAGRDGLPCPGVRVVVSVPDGEHMARKTTNPRLGIVGGISILGTTGIVRPFSTAAWRASVGQAVDVIAAQGWDTFVLTTGGRTETSAMRLRPDLDEVCFIEVGDFTGHALRRGVRRGLRHCLFVGMAGKLAKLAAGVMMTHWTRSKVDTGLLACLTAEAGGDPALVGSVAAANTARHAYELWAGGGLVAPGGVCDRLCEQVAANLHRFAGGRLDVEVILVDFRTLAPAGYGRRRADA